MRPPPGWYDPIMNHALKVGAFVSLICGIVSVACVIYIVFTV